AKIGEGIFGVKYSSQHVFLVQWFREGHTRSDLALIVKYACLQIHLDSSMVIRVPT
ncbi:hypothetical protein ABKV19_017120, partial [Rosa sericea]